MSSRRYYFTDPVENAEDQFRRRVDTTFQVTVATLAVTAAVTPVACPPVSIAAGAAIPVVTGIHYVDKKNDYAISHWFADRFRAKMHSILHPSVRTEKVKLPLRSNQTNSSLWHRGKRVKEPKEALVRLTKS